MDPRQPPTIAIREEIDAPSSRKTCPVMKVLRGVERVEFRRGKPVLFPPPPGICARTGRLRKRRTNWSPALDHRLKSVLLLLLLVNELLELLQLAADFVSVLGRAGNLEV